MIEIITTILLGVWSFFSGTPIVYAQPDVYNEEVHSQSHETDFESATFLVIETPTASTTTVGFSIQEPKPVECRCVEYLREVYGVNISGDAGTHTPNITFNELEYGDVVLMRYENVDHVAMYVSHNNEGITVQESNYKPCEPTTRIIDYGDESLVGFYRPE